MTLVTALKMGTRIVILSDTKITNSDHVRPNSIPGRIKAIVLSRTLSVAYAGLSSQALDAIRQIYRRAPSSLGVAFEVLIGASIRHLGELDFIVCSHADPERPRLIKVQSGQIYEGADFYWIGSAQSANALAKLGLEVGHHHGPITEQEKIESKYTREFIAHLQNGDDPSVGGLMINCLCSPYGHCYQNHAGAIGMSELRIPPLDDEAVQLRKRKSGETDFSYHVYSSPDRGAAIVGCYFEQPEVGYFHRPLFCDEPTMLRAADQAEFYALLHERAPSLLQEQSGV